MERPAVASLPAAEQYQCPGARYTIDRSVHLARLAAYYPACRGCEHRHEVQSLSPPQRVGWAQLERRPPTALRGTGESIESSTADAFTPAEIRRLAERFAALLWQKHSRAKQPPMVVVGTDGRPSTVDLLAAACEALAIAGCCAIEAQGTTSASLGALLAARGADAAIWLGDASGAGHALAAKFYGSGFRPWSAPGDLDALAAMIAARQSRPRRGGGTVERGSADDRYLSAFVPLYHALRPLRLVVDARSAPLLAHLRMLIEPTACEVLVASTSESDLSRSSRALGRQVVDRHAHLGVWIDGDGEACHVVDERGALVHDEAVALLIAKHLLAERAALTLVLHAEADAKLAENLRQLGARIERAVSTRQCVHEAMHRFQAACAIGPNGRLWYGNEPFAADALFTLSLLLVILSQSDRDLSQVLDAPRSGK